MSATAELRRRLEALSHEIRNYPTPIARCDEQLTQLLEALLGAFDARVVRVAVGFGGRQRRIDFPGHRGTCPGILGEQAIQKRRPGARQAQHEERTRGAA